MSRNFYAGKLIQDERFGELLAPVIPYDAWARTLPATETGEPVNNPAYQPYGGLSLTREQSDSLLEALGHPVGPGEALRLAINPAQAAIARALDLPWVTDALRARLAELSFIISYGKGLGARYFVAA